MSSKTKLLLICGIATVVAIAIGFVLAIDNRPDEILIKEALAKSIEDSKEGRAGSMIEFISDEIKINDQAAGVSKSRIAKYIRDSKPVVTLTNQNVTLAPDGKTAEMQTDVKVAGEIGELTFKRPFDYSFTDVKITFTKEDGRKYLFFPAKVWRVSGVDVPADQEMIQFGLGF